MILLLDERQQEELAQYLLERTTKTRTETMCFHLKHNWKQDSPLTEFQEGDLYICLEYRRVIVHEQEIALTIKEFDILLLPVSYTHLDVYKRQSGSFLQYETNSQPLQLYVAKRIRTSV